MTIDRINQLFESGYITAEEHNELIQQKVVVEKKNSTYSYLTIFLALTGYFLMLVFTKNNTEFKLLANGTQRLWAGMTCSALGIFTFVISRKQIKPHQNKEHLAYIGIGLIMAMLIINIPVLLMSID